jgi:hypothetical protein
LFAPKSSFSTMSGVVQPAVCETALWYAFWAAASSVDGSVGAVGVPTLFLSLRSNEYVAAPRARASVR